MTTRNQTQKSTTRAARTTKQAKPEQTILDAAVAAAEAEGIVIPSWKRVLAASALSIVLSAGTGYAIGAAAEVVAMGVFVLTGSFLLVFLTWFVAIIISLYAGLKISQHVGNYVLTGQIDRDIVKVKNKVMGFFDKPRLVAVM